MEASITGFNSRSNACWWIPISCCACYRDPATPKAATYRLSDLELASRLSFFLWSSIPDDHLLTLAEHGELNNPQNLEKEVRRMLADPRATDALVNNFAAQWLNLRQVEDVVVDPTKYPLLRRESAAGIPAGNRNVRRPALCARIAVWRSC